MRRKLLAYGEWASTDEPARGLAAFQHRYNEHAEPFDWKWNRQQLDDFIGRLSKYDNAFTQARQALKAHRASHRNPITNY